MQGYLQNARHAEAAVKTVYYDFDGGELRLVHGGARGGENRKRSLPARLAGHEVNVILPDDYGVHTYDDVIFTSEELIRRNPALVERWLRATLAGWRYAVEHPEEAVEITLKVDPTLKRDKQMAMLLASIPLIHTGQWPIGWMTREVWEEAAGILLDQKILRHRPELGKAYTTRFLEKATGR